MAPKKADTKRPDDDGPKVYVQVSVSWIEALMVSRKIKSLAEHYSKTEADTLS